MITRQTPLEIGTEGTAETPQPSRVGLWVGLVGFVFIIALLLSWMTHRRLDSLFDRLDVRAINSSAQVLQQLLDERRSHLTSAVSVLSEDARIRAMIMTPTFDPATAHDLLSDIKATSKASVVAVLDSEGRVSAVVGATEMHHVNLGTSTLVKDALKQPSARVWAFAGKVGVLAAAPVRLGAQVRAVFLMGFEIDDSLLAGLERALGANSAVFVGAKQVASSNHEPDIARALALAAELPPGTYQVVAETFLASSSRLSDSAGAATVAWTVPLHRNSRQAAVSRSLSWLPAVLVGLLMLALIIGAALSQSKKEQSPSHLS